MIDQAFYTAIKGIIDPLNAYPVIAEDNAVPPFTVYQRISTIRDRDLSGETGRVEASYRVDVYHQDLEEAENLAQVIASGLIAYKGNGIRDISIEGEENASDLSGDPTLYRWILSVRVVYA